MQIKHILFPVDFSPESAAAKSDVEWLAAKFGATVTLLHVFDIPTAYYGGVDVPFLGNSQAADFAALAKRDLENYAIDVPAERLKRVLREGGPAPHIAQLAKDESPDLIVMGTRGNGIFRRMLLGSVAMKVLHDVDVPVWTCNRSLSDGQRTRIAIRRVVCPVDLSEETVPLLRYAAEVSHIFEAEVELVHAVPSMAGRPSRYCDTPLHLALEEIAREDLESIQKQAGTHFPLTITGDAVVQDVLERASHSNADLILIGRGHMQMRFGSLRSHAFDVIRASSCPVLSVCLSAAPDERGTEELQATSSEA